MLENKTKKTIYINFFQPIEMQQVNGLMGLLTQLLGKNNPDEICLLLSSSGGSVDAGITIYNFLKSLPVEITTYNIGSINSIANVVFVAGKNRYASPHSSFLFHGVQSRFKGEFSFTLEKLKEITSQLVVDQDKIAGILSQNTSLTKKDIKALFREGESKDTGFAKEKGIISDIKEAKIPKGATIITIG